MWPFSPIDGVLNFIFNQLFQRVSAIMEFSSFSVFFFTLVRNGVSLLMSRYNQSNFTILTNPFIFLKFHWNFPPQVSRNSSATLRYINSVVVLSLLQIALVFFRMGWRGEAGLHLHCLIMFQTQGYLTQNKPGWIPFESKIGSKSEIWIIPLNVTSKIEFFRRNSFKIFFALLASDSGGQYDEICLHRRIPVPGMSEKPGHWIKLASIRKFRHP